MDDIERAGFERRVNELDASLKLSQAQAAHVAQLCRAQTESLKQSEHQCEVQRTQNDAFRASIQKVPEPEGWERRIDELEQKLKLAGAQATHMAGRYGALIEQSLHVEILYEQWQPRAFGTGKWRTN